MSGTMRRWLPLVLVSLGLVCYFALLKWAADPVPSAADTQSPRPPKQQARMHETHPRPRVSLVFILDSSLNMQPRVGTNYFEMAKDGIAKFLSKPDFPDDGTYEISVIQYAKRGVPGYVQGDPDREGTHHWFGPLHIVEDPDPASPNEATIAQAITLIEGLEHTRHFTGSLLESGLREAAAPLQESAGDDDTLFEAILLSTGEYRLPQPCPPMCYNHPTDTTEPCSPSSWNGFTSCDSATDDPTCSSVIGPRTCNRACQSRYYADQLRSIARTRLSAVHLGPVWHNWYGCAPEPGNPSLGQTPPYGSNPNYCSQPPRPDREGFLKELINWASANGEACNNDQAAGRYVRIGPGVQFGCAFVDGGCPREGTAVDIARTIGRWLCDWAAEDGGNWADQNPDGDYFDQQLPLGQRTQPILSICDSCPHDFNPTQRDCNADGVGDLCQTSAMDCGTGPGDTLDSDHDGVCNGVDQCVGGDDCLVRYWANPDPCPDASDPDMSLCECNLASCGCDCDRFGGADLCQAAIRFNCETLGLCEPDQGDNDTEDGIEDTDYNGIPQCAEDTFAPTLCIPVPSKCDLLVDTDPAGNPVDVFLLDFRESIGSASAATWLTNKGWHLSDPHAEGALLISATGSDFQDGMPDGAHECQLATGTGYLEIGTPSDLTQVDAIWFLETKAFAFPPITHCAIAERREWDWPNWVCVPSNCPTVGRWSFMSIDVVLQIINDGTGRDWELAVLDGCTPSDQERERLRLAFVDEPYACSSPQNCLVENGTCDCGGKIHVVQYGADGVPYPSSDDLPYRHGQWFRLRVTLDNTSGYWIDNGVCRFRHLTTATEWPPESVRVRIQRHEGDSECYTRSLGLLSETYLGSGPATASDEVRGIRIRFTSSNEGGGTMRVGAIQFRPTDGCELAVGPGPLPHLPWPCSQEDPCHCDDARSWYCQADMDDCNYRCGNRWQDADEECDPPNTASCSESCHWVCGDGILQGLNTAHCSLLGWPANGHCGAGTEECDDGNTTNGDGCSADCDLEAP